MSAPEGAAAATTANRSRTRSPLDDPLQYRKGVGPHAAAALSRLGLTIVGDLLTHWPRRWEDRTRFRHAADVRNGELVTVCGSIIGVTTTYPRPKLPITKALLDDQGAALTLTWFNQPYMEKTLKKLATERRKIVVYGQAKRAGWGIEIVSPEWEELGEDTLSMNRIVPVYPSTEGIRQATLRRLVYEALEEYLPLIDDALPADIVARCRLASRREALRGIHFPASEEEREEARRRLVFEELFLLQTRLALKRLGQKQERGIVLGVSAAELAESLGEIVPFDLTGAQQRAIREIAEDVQSGRAMNRLLQGDVGSGKTVVALAAMLMAVRNGCQAALMAPTEILAQQHAIVLRRMLDPLGISVELAIGSQTGKFKAELRDRLLGGQSHIAVGTHALIQEGVEFARLGLVVIDEQHRFGVRQRMALRQKGEMPHVLVMTATPIPRTLTMTLYGDLDVSVLDELPPGRKPIVTHWKAHDRRLQVYSGVQRLLREGRQVYIVCPLVEASEKLQAKSAIQLSEHIARDVFPSYRVGLLHGQLKSEEKDAVMARFKAHEIDILVSTTVIEVGIDVPNASAIVIEDAERFGLAQLHQLRGRVGRGEHASFCVLIADPKTDEGRARLGVMTETCDGFRIAEEDLRLRGPGEFYGTRQSGMPELTIADIIRDVDVLAETRRAAFELAEADPALCKPENRALRAALEQGPAGLELVAVS